MRRPLPLPLLPVRPRPRPWALVLALVVLLGVLLPAAPAALPAGTVAGVVPAGRYLRHLHTGPVERIGEAFGAMHEEARRAGAGVGPVKLDVGYTRDGADTGHELFVQLVGSAG